MPVKTQGTILKWNAATIGEVNNISGLSSPSTKIPLPSFADTVMRYRPGRRKGGELTFEGNFNPDNVVQAALETDRQAGTSRTVVLTAPTGSINDITFTGVVMNYTISADDDDIYKFQITIKLKTKPVRS